MPNQQQTTLNRSSSAARLSRAGIGLLFCIGILFPLANAKAQCFPSAPGLVAWWPGDGNANVIVGTNNGVLQGGATATASGFIGQAFSFDGTNNYVQIADSPTVKPTNLTVECWVRFTGLDSAGSGPGAGVQYIVFKQNTRSSGFEGYDLGKTRSGGIDYFKFFLTGAGGQTVTLQGSTAVSTGVWYHIAGVRGSNFAQLYVNGQLERQTNVSFPQDYGTNPLYFGTSGQSFWDRRLRGVLDEVSLYDRALSSNQIAAIFAAGAAGKCKQVLIATQPQTQTAVIGSNVTFTVSATGLAPLSYQWRLFGTNLPGEISINLVRLNVQPSQAGNYTVVVSNSLGAVTSAVAVLTVGVPPSVSVPPQNQAVDQGQTSNFSVTAAGSLPLSYQWRFNGGNISGATTSTLAIAGAQASNAGNYSVVVTNFVGSITSSVATLAVNTPPILPSQSNRIVPEQALMTVNNTATDNDLPANTLTYNLNAINLATGLPIGNAGINSSGVITWTPTEAQGPSTNSFTTIVSDGSMKATNSFIVTVTEVNTAPTLPAQSSRTIAEQTLLTVTNTGSDVDLPANVLTYSLAATNLATGIQIFNVAIDGTGIISWTPTEAQGPSTNVITTIVSDGAATATNSFLVVVTEVNTPPVLSPQIDRTIAEQTLMTVNNGAIDADLPVNTLTYSLAVTNVGTGLQVLNASIDAGGLISWTPSEAQGPSTNVFTTIVSDGNATATNNFIVVVTEVNTPPSLPVQNNQTLAEQTLMAVNNGATDIDLPANILTYSLAVTNTATGLQVINASIDANGVISWTPSEAQGPSTNTFTTIVSDGSATATNVFTVVVTEVNTAPVLSVQSTRTIPEQTLLSVNNAANDADIPANVLTYSLAATNLATGLPLANASIDATGLISWIPTEAQGPSTNSFTTIVSDGNLTATNVFTVVVLEVNVAPVLSIQSTRTIDEQTLLMVNNSANDADLPPNTLTYTLAVTNLSTGEPVNDASIDATGLIMWTPTEAQGPSLNEFTTIVSDGIATTTNSFIVFVNEVNNPPGLPSQINRVIAEQTLLTVNNTATDIDLPANVLTFTLAVTNLGNGLPVGNASIDINGIITWTPTEAQGPSTNVFVTVVNDGLASATNSFVVTVTEVNTVPTLPPQILRTMLEATLLTITNTAVDPDLPIQTLVYTLSVTNIGTGLQVVNASIDSNGIISWHPTIDQGPSTNILVTRVTDGLSSVTNSFIVIVNEVNTPPVLPEQSNRTIAEQTVLTVTNSATDSDIPANVLTYTLTATDLGTGLPVPNASIDSGGIITWPPTEAQGPSTNVFVTVVNDGTASVTNSFIVVVTEINVAPLLPFQSDRIIAEQTLMAVDNGATDPDLPVNPLTYTLTVTNVGDGTQVNNASIDSAGQITWTPTEAQGPSTNSFQTVVDDGNARTTNLFIVRVLEANIPPTLPSQGDRLIAELSTLTVTNTATDPDIPANSLMYQLINPPSGMTISADGVISWTPTTLQAPNVYTIKTVVNDGTANVTNSFQVTVYQVNCTFIADYNLSNMVYLALGRTEGCIARTEMLTLTNLRASHLEITNLSGIEWASNLTSLQLSGNAISDLTPLSGMRQLVELFVDGNRISNLAPLATRTNLRVLDVGANPLTDLSPLSGLTFLTNLAVYDNRLPNLAAIQNLKQLAVLSAYGNRVRDITPVIGFTNLQRLDLRWNFITNQTLLSGMTNLSALFLAGNNISNINFLSPLTRMSLLHLADNAISDVSPLSSLTNLSYLTLSGNQPITNYGVISGLTGLASLELRGNALSNVAFLSSLGKLSYVDLANNNISTLSPLSILTNLSVVLIGNSNLDLTTGLTHPTALWLGGSTLTNLPPLTNLSGLVAFGLEGSSVTDLSPITNLPSINSLCLNSNLVTNFSALGGLTNLSSLWLESTRLTNVGFLPVLTKLRNLSVAKNRIRSLAGLEGLTNLSSVYLTYNRLTNITVLSSWINRARVEVGGNLLDANGNAKQALQQLKWMNGGVWVGYDPVNKPPTFSSDTLQAAFTATAPKWFIPANTASLLPFPVSDDLIPANELTVTADSGNQTLLPLGNLLLSGSDSSRSLTVTPALNQTGIANIALTVTDDPGGLSTVTNIEVNVLSPVSVPIPDLNLSNALCVAVGKPNGNLNIVDLLGLAAFTATSRSISNLSGLEWATNLTSLDLSANRINNLTPLQSLSRLSSLTVFSNLLTDLSALSGLGNLGTLDVSWNPIANYNSLTSGFSGLNILSLYGNSISNVTFLQNRFGLTSLNLGYNRIQNTSPLGTLTNLNFLFLQHNILINIGPLTALTNLDYLDLTLNLLTLTNGSPARTVVNTLTAAGTVVLTDPQRSPPIIDARTNWLINANVSSSVPFSVVDGDNYSYMTVSANTANPSLLPSVGLTQSNATNWNLNVTPAAGQLSGTATILIAATNDVGLRTNLTMTVRITTYLPVDNQLLNSSGLNWTNIGNSPWFGQSVITHDGVSAAQSGPVGDGQESTLQTTMIGPGQLTFWWKVSSEINFDYLDLIVNGVLTTNRISGEVDWQQRSFTLPAGTNIVIWRYSRDKDTSFGLDAGWLDQVTFFNGLRLEYVGFFNNTNSLLRLYGVQGKNYEIQSATNMPPGTNWAIVGALTATNDVMTFVDTNAISGRRFFRAREK